MRPAIVFQEVSVFDSRNATLEAGPYDVCVQGGQIRWIETPGKRPYPAGAWLEKAEGCVLLPGLIDAHVHICAIFHEDPSPNVFLWAHKQVQKNFETVLRTGFTTVRDMMSPIHFLNKLRGQVNSGHIPGPRILSPGPFVAPPGGYPHFMPRVPPVLEWLLGPTRYFLRHTSEVDQCMRWLKRNGADFVKSALSHYKYDDARSFLPRFDDEMFETIYRSAHRHGLKVAVHHSHREDFQKALRVPIDTLEHLSLDDDITDEEAIALRERGIPCVPTISVGRDMALEFPAESPAFRALLDSPECARVLMPQSRQFVEEAARNRWAPRFIRIQSKDVAMNQVIHHERNFKTLLRNGVTMGSGTDAGVPVSFFCHLRKELEYLVEWGMTPSQALQAATWNNAAIIGHQDFLGAVEPGRVGDLLLVEGNPTERISDIYNLRKIYKNGVPYEPWNFPSDRIANK